MDAVRGTRLSYVKVAVVCAHRPVARALAALLEAQVDMEVVGLATTCKDGLALVQRAPPDVVVVDYQFPDGNAAAMTSVIRVRHPGTATLVLDAEDPPESLVAAAAAGAAGWLPKSAGHLRVVTAVRRVARGAQLIEPGQLAAFRPTPRPTGPRAVSASTGSAPLSRRQQAVLALILEGLDERTIAERFGVRHATVRRHLRRALAKLQAGSLTEGLAKALQWGLLTNEMHPATSVAPPRRASVV
jgi:DNA-binding NarL/FixJ family response regulator